MTTQSYKVKDILSLLGRETAAVDPEAEITEFAIDSRSVVEPASTLFIALTTSTGDGHRYIGSLYEAGVRNFLVDHLPDIPMPEANFIVVDDTLAALQKLAAARRSKVGVSDVIAITGSRGKTVTKELIYRALKLSGADVARSPRSFNSQIGVPLSMLMLDGDADCWIIEAGVSEAGEMNKLEEIIAPDRGVIICATDEHAENFSSRRELIAEKLKLFATCSTIYYNANDPEISSALKATYPDRTLVGVDAAYPTDESTDRALAEAVTGAKLPALLDDFHPSTRLDVIEGVNGCKLIVNRFTPDINSLSLAADFMHRRAPKALNATLVLSTDGFDADDADEISSIVTKYGFKRLILVGHSDVKDIPGVAIERYQNEDALYKSLAASDFANEIILIQGTPAAPLDRLYAMVEAKQHETVLEVNLDAVVNNFNFFRSKIKPSTGIICMLKAAGYGAGSVELARTLQAHGAAYLAVAVVDEGVELRQAGITMPIMVLNPRAQNSKMMFDYCLEPEVYSFEMLDEIVKAARRYGVKNFPIHIKLETGMRRLGFMPDEITALADRLLSSDEVTASTIFSHLACADDPTDDDYTAGQFATFNTACDLLDSRLGRKVRRHILNSTGIVRFPEQQHSFVRLGIGLYGIATLNDGSMNGLRPVSTLSSVIISIKEWPAGTSIGYNRRTRLSRPSVIATVPVGYADGLDRHFGNGGAAMSVCGLPAPIVGNVCMDITMIDITDIVARGHDIKIGDRVEIFGNEVSVIDMAGRIGTIPYEILTSISPRVKRVYYRE